MAKYTKDLISGAVTMIAVAREGLVIDYIGIKKQMNLALAHYNKADQQNVGDIFSNSDLLEKFLPYPTQIVFGQEPC